MSVLRTFAAAVSILLTTIAKTVGGMSGAQTFGHDNATEVYKRRDDYRP